MRSFGRPFQTDAVAGGDQATADMDPELREDSRISADGAWWWDGREWVATGTPDGLWEWDGERWRPTIELRGVRARDLATTLAFLAEDRYARASVILVERAAEWRPSGEVRDLVGRAIGLRRGLLRVEAAVRGVAAGAPGLLRRVRASPEERRRMEEEHTLLDGRYRSLLVQIGRRAPRPTVKEADDLLEVARTLDTRATRITEALTAADEAERARAHAIEAARRDVRAAEAAAAREIRSAAAALEQAKEQRARERGALRERLRQAVAPPAGQPLAAVGPLRVHTTAVETPAGLLSLVGAAASAGPAASLWRGWRDVVQDLLLVETPEAEAFLRCLTERRRDRFLLLTMRSSTVLWHCPPGEERPLRQFVTAVNQQATLAAAPTQARLRAADALRGELAGQDDDDVVEARAALARAEAEQRAAAVVETARCRLAEARGEPPELVAARRQAAAEVQAVSTPPPPLAAD